MARRSRQMDTEYELNLAPIMNVVMILIPLLLISQSFVIVATLEVHSPQNAQSTTPPEQEETEEVPVPRVMVAVAESGFYIADLGDSPAFRESELGNQRGEACPPPPGAAIQRPVPVTICPRQGVALNRPLIERLDFRELYNRLVEIYEFPAWKAQWNGSNMILNIGADPDIPVEAVLRVMDVGRFMLTENNYGEDEVFHAAVYREDRDAGDCSSNRDCELGTCRATVCIPNLFPDPVLLLPRAAAE